MDYPFPNSIDFQAALALAQIVRNGELADKRGEALQHAGWLAGSIGKRLTNDTNGFLTGAADCSDKCCDLDATASFICETLENDDATEPVQAFGANPIANFAIKKLVAFVLRSLLDD